MKQSKFFRVGGVAPLAIAALVAAAGCKGKTTVKDNPETLSRLENCNTNLADKKTAMERLEAELAQFKVAGASANEFVVTIQGDALEIKARPSGGGGTPSVSDAVALDLSNKFIDLVRKSRGNIQKCYEQALKKNASLQARTISLQVTARYGSDGDVTKSTFRPDSLGSAFDTCMQAVAKNWKLPATASGMSFQSTVTLSPS